MYKSFRVKNFRCFKDLEVKDLGRVNLIAGRNNTGKTALMEAMYLLTKPLSPWVLFDLQRNRGLESPTDYASHHWKQFFYQLDSAKRIRIDGADSNPSTCRELTISDHEARNKNPSVLEAIRTDLSKFGVAGTDSRIVLGSIDRYLQLDFATDGAYIDPVYFFSIDWLYGNRIFEQASIFIPAQGRPTKEQVASDFSQLEIDATLSSLIDVLKILEPRISDLRLLSPDKELIVWAQLGAIRLPLRQLGEGVNRTCDFAIRLLTNPSSIIFIDEIENGLHHSVQCKVWQAIGKLARELDIQVFATTHSLEMIRAAYQAFSADEKLEDFRYHRLDRDPDSGDIDAVTYNEFGINAVAAFNFEHEVR